jgi:hypothetical protein
MFSPALSTYTANGTIGVQPFQGATSNNTQEVFWGSNGLGFDDVLDAINPLNHLPLVSNFFDASSTEEGTSPGSRIVGGALFGGAVGLLSSFVMSTLQQIQQEDAPTTQITTKNDNVVGSQVGNEVANVVAGQNERKDFSKPQASAVYNTEAFLSKYKQTQFLANLSPAPQNTQRMIFA